jgi:very-short-patch-repair endonuclease
MLRGVLATRAEMILWKCIRAKQLGVKFRRQYNIGTYIVDFYCHEVRLVLELDGWVHGEEERKKKDEIRQVWLESQGYIIKRYRNEQIAYELECVVEDLYSTIKSIQRTKDPT